MEKQTDQGTEPRQNEIQDLSQREAEAKTLNDREQETARGGGGGVPGSPRDRRQD